MASIRYEIDNSVPLMKHLDVEIFVNWSALILMRSLLSQICSFVIFVWSYFCM